MPYIGIEPVPKATKVRTFGTLGIATNTISIPGGFAAGNIEVFANGGYVLPTDYDDSDGLNLVFIQTLDAGTDYVVMEARAFEVANHYTKQQIQDAAFDFNTMPTVGGAPVVESGSNADGEYTKFADGTAICSHLQLCTFNNTSRLIADWVFPSAYITVPIVLSTAVDNRMGGGTFVYQDNASATDFIEFIRVVTANSAAIRFISGGSVFVSGDTYYMPVTAIGRWK